MSLGRKQNISNQAWLDAVATIEDTISREQLDELTAATVEDIRATVEGSGRPTPGAPERTVSFSATSARLLVSPTA